MTFNANGGDATGTMAEQLDQTVVSSGTSIRLTPNAFTRPGYAFLGWATSSRGQKEYEDGAPFQLTMNTTLYAYWVGLILSANDGSGRTVKQAATTNVPLTSAPFSRPGYRFDGWSDRHDEKVGDDGTVIWQDGARYDFSSIQPSGSRTLYAKWSCLPLGSWTVSGKRVSADRAEITFSAPTNGTADWTTFTAKSTEDSESGSVSQSSATGTITVSGLRKHQGYRFTVTGRNSGGCSYTSDVTNRVEQWNKK
ncbi:MAG: InlB B-repeat-containing protein [Actinomycetales bacterium]|nr:InlB B-repeat-containing protein [Actinomycetales bacterium]